MAPHTNQDRPILYTKNSQAGPVLIDQKWSTQAVFSPDQHLHCIYSSTLSYAVTLFRGMGLSGVGYVWNHLVIRLSNTWLHSVKCFLNLLHLKVFQCVIKTDSYVATSLIRGFDIVFYYDFAAGNSDTNMMHKTNLWLIDKCTAAGVLVRTTSTHTKNYKRSKKYT